MIEKKNYTAVDRYGNHNQVYRVQLECGHYCEVAPTYPAEIRRLTPYCTWCKRSRKIAR